MMRGKIMLAVGVAALVSLEGAPAFAGACRDPWITQAIKEVTGREPNGSGETGECTYTQYGGGRWSSYSELKGYVAARVGRPAAAGQTSVQPAPPPTPKANPLLANQNLGNLNTTTFANQNTKKAFVDRLVQDKKTINGKTYFQADGLWYEQTDREFGTTIGVPVAGTLKIDAKKITQATVQNGKALVLVDGKWMRLIGNDGSTLIGNDSAGILSNANAALINRLVGNDGASLVGNDGASLIGNDSAGLSKLAKMVAAGGGNMVAAGGLNLVAAAGGNAVPTGAGNFISTNGATFISTNGATVAGNQNANNFISTNGSTLGATNNSRIISDNSGGIARGSTAVPTGAGNILSSSNGAAVAPAGSYRAYSTTTQPASSATAAIAGGDLTIRGDQAQQWRAAPNGKPQFAYNGKWYDMLSNANGMLVGKATAEVITPKPTTVAAAGSLTIRNAQAQQWRAAPDGKPQFLYNGRWYDVVSNVGDTLVGK